MKRVSATALALDRHLAMTLTPAAARLLTPQRRRSMIDEIDNGRE
jgi:hypothetical protein